MKQPGRDLFLNLAEESEQIQGLSYAVGNGTVKQHGETVSLQLGVTPEEMYSNAQVDDYHQTGEMRWRAPVVMKVHARFSGTGEKLRGTAGFGFWNDPLGMTRQGDHQGWLPRVRLPQAIWFFFAAQPSQMPLARRVPGWGWKAATIDASSALARVLLPVAPLGMLACRVPVLYHVLWPLAQRVLKIDERVVPVSMDAWHVYELQWRKDGARFVVDGEVVLQTPFAPRGPLGFVAWIDNQFMVATPQGVIQHGVVSVEGQGLDLAALEVTRPR